MKTLKNIIVVTTAVLFLLNCSSDNGLSDAYGNFEADEVLIASEIGGKIVSIPVEEGSQILQNDLICSVDTVQILLQRKQIEAQIDAVASKKANIEAQISVLKEQKINLEVELVRVKKLLANEAATKKQLDDITGNLNLLDKQIASVSTQFGSINNEIGVFQAQIRISDDKLMRAKVYSPINGTVLKKFAEEGEIAAPGKALVKIADISNLYLRAYVSGAQLSQITLLQEVTVLIDSLDGETQLLKGTITFISESAEFTPKIIQTKEERVDLVYAIKVKVANTGVLKIGMPGEVVFNDK